MKKNNPISKSDKLNSFSLTARIGSNSVSSMKAKAAANRGNSILGDLTILQKVNFFTENSSSSEPSHDSSLSRLLAWAGIIYLRKRPKMKKIPDTTKKGNLNPPITYKPAPTIGPHDSPRPTAHSRNAIA